MKYQICTLDEKENKRIVWFTFQLVNDRDSKNKIIDLLYYFKNNTTFENFYIFEIDSNGKATKAYKLEKVFSYIINILKKIEV